MKTNISPARIATGWLLSAALGAGCSSTKNHEERANTPQPDAVAQSQAGAAGCVGACLPDPGSRKVDCAGQEAGFVFDWRWDLAAAMLAPFTYTYDDGSTDLAPDPLRIWQPPATRFEWPEGSIGCGENLAVNFRGGPYTSFGGGFGRSFCTIGANLCTSLDPVSPELVPNASGDFAGLALDATGWEGVALWVRRGPNGEATLRVSVTEKHSSEDLNTGGILNGAMEPLQESRYCARVRPCGCANGTPCSPHPSGGAYCFDPALDPDPELSGLFACGEARCNAVNTSTEGSDPLFENRACTAAITSDGLLGSFCYNPGQDPEPPAKREKCGNPFALPVQVSLDWQLIKVPFSELRQADEGHIAVAFDISTIKQLVFTYAAGFSDFYVKNIGFYRKAD